MHTYLFGKAVDFPGVTYESMRERIRCTGAFPIARVFLPRVINQSESILRDFLDLLRASRMDFAMSGYLPFVLHAVRPENYENLRLLARYGAIINTRERFMVMKRGQYRALLKGGHPAFEHPELPMGIKTVGGLLQALQDKDHLLIPVGEIIEHFCQIGDIDNRTLGKDMWALHKLRIEGFIP